MAIIKCKMCGGDLTVEENSQIAVCEYCGTQQTVPKQDNEKKLTLFARANRLRFACEFDKAAGVYESIVAEFPEEAEAYWGLVLCKYGIEYVDDPATGKKVPTCHRSSFDSVLEDANFELVMEYADAVTRKLYREEAKAIEELRRGIIEVSSREEPYDIFICYKETDENGQRTLDSVLAQDIYDALTQKGYRVFFSRITLEDKLGQEYEPYIFAALNSARVMLVVGTDYEYFNAPWVKNEWSRYLQLIAAGQKKSLIPCYKNIDAYDMPKEFAKLQAQDLGKVGATQDLLRGIDKLIGKAPAAPQPAPQPQQADPKVPLLKRAGMYLTDGDFASAKQYANRVLDLDPEEPHAYIYLLLAELKIKTTNEEALVGAPELLEAYPDYRKARRFATGSYKQTLDELRMKQKKLLYTRAVSDQPMAESESDMLALAARFDALGDYGDSKARSSELMLKVGALRRAREQKKQEEKQLQEEETARKRQEQTEREERARQRAAREEAERRSREEAVQRRKSRGVALHIGLCVALAAFLAFSSVFRMILAADSGGTYLCVLGIYFIFTILQGIIMRSHKTPEAFANLPTAGGMVYAIFVIVVNLLMPGESPDFFETIGMIVGTLLLGAICSGIGLLCKVFRRGMDD